MTGAEERPCPVCGALFTWTPAAPRQRFCSVPCRHQWWNHRRRQATAALSQAGTETAPDGHEPRGGPPRGGAPRAGDGATVAVPACPHCRKPVAVVAWLVPPAAATIDTPRHADNNP